MRSTVTTLRSLRLAAFALTLVCAALSAGAQQEVVATMGTQQLRAAELKRLIDALTPEARKRLGTDLGALDRLVREELVRQTILTEARQQSWDKRPDVQLLIERARDQALLQAYVGNLTRPPAGYPTDDEIKGYYEASKASLTVPAEYLIAQIFIASPDGADKAQAASAQKKAAELAARVQKAPGEFAKVAKESSEHKDSSAKGGELGWVSENQLIAEVRSAVLRMTKGEVSAPIRSASGWHIVRLSDRKPSVVQPLAEVRDQVALSMRTRRMQEAERAYIEGLLSKSNVQINQADLQKLQSGIK